MSNFQNSFLSQLVLKNIKKTASGFEFKININAFLNNLKEMRREIKMSDNVKNIKTMFIFGGNSPYFSENDKKYVKDTLPKSEIKIIEGAGHNIHIEKENELFETVFLFSKSF